MRELYIQLIPSAHSDHSRFGNEGKAPPVPPCFLVDTDRVPYSQLWTLIVRELGGFCTSTPPGGITRACFTYSYKVGPHPHLPAISEAFATLTAYRRKTRRQTSRPGCSRIWTFTMKMHMTSCGTSQELLSGAFSGSSSKKFRWYVPINDVGCPVFATSHSSPYITAR